MLTVNWLYRFRAFKTWMLLLHHTQNGIHIDSIFSYELLPVKYNTLFIFYLRPNTDSPGAERELEPIV